MDSKEKDLHRKYINNALRSDEVEALRRSVLNSDDDELEQVMLEAWDTEGLQSNTISERQQSLLLDRIHNSIQSTSSPFMPNVRKIYRYAAMIFCPILLLLVSYLYFQDTNIDSNVIIVSTNAKQMANVTLPDGTIVNLNEESQLRYQPDKFNNKHRNIELEGEAYFDVAKNKSVPFIIETAQMRLKVLGTKFNFNNCKNNNYIKVELIEGSVKLQSNNTDKSLLMRPGDEVIYNKDSDDFTLRKKKYINNCDAWIKGGLIFEKEPLQNVLAQIEDFYNTKIGIDSLKTRTNDTFTGTIPIDNIDEAIKILEYSFK